MIRNISIVRFIGMELTSVHPIGSTEFNSSLGEFLGGYINLSDAGVRIVPCEQFTKHKVDTEKLISNQILGLAPVYFVWHSKENPEVIYHIREGFIGRTQADIEVNLTVV